MSYVYKKTEPGLWTVGCDDPQGKWHPDSDWNTTQEAADRCHYLNGGNPPAKPMPDNEDAQELLGGFPMMRLAMRLSALVLVYEQQDRELMDARSGLPLEDRNLEAERAEDGRVMLQREREVAKVAREVFGFDVATVMQASFRKKP